MYSNHSKTAENEKEKEKCRGFSLIRETHHVSYK